MFVVIHYSEIGLKGKNRVFFEKKLVDNIGKSFGINNRIFRRYGKLVIKINSDTEIDQLMRKLSLIPGIASYAPAESSQLKLADLKKTLDKLLQSQNFNTFAIVASRSNKNFPLSSPRINELVGDYVRTKFKKKVKLNKPDLKIHLEVGEKEIFVYFKQYPGPGGLPVGSSGKAVALLSGGIDSPVASFLAMKRGLEVIFVHIFNKTVAGGRQGNKLERIVKQLAKVQGKSKLYIIPFEDIQKIIIAKIPGELRMIVYRRFMMEIAAKVAEKEKAKGIITGDSVGQVASQTLDNLKCIYGNTDLPVLPPLIGMNKEEIIKIAKKIKTYKLSIIPYPDCCSFMIARHPETRGEANKIKQVEGLIADKENLVENCLSKATINFIK